MKKIILISTILILTAASFLEAQDPKPPMVLNWKQKIDTIAIINNNGVNKYTTNGLFYPFALGGATEHNRILTFIKNDSTEYGLDSKKSLWQVSLLDIKTGELLDYKKINFNPYWFGTFGDVFFIPIINDTLYFYGIASGMAPDNMFTVFDASFCFMKMHLTENSIELIPPSINPIGSPHNLSLDAGTEKIYLTVKKGTYYFFRYNFIGQYGNTWQFLDKIKDTLRVYDLVYDEEGDSTKKVLYREVNLLSRLPNYLDTAGKVIVRSSFGNVSDYGSEGLFAIYYAKKEDVKTSPQYTPISDVVYKIVNFGHLNDNDKWNHNRVSYTLSEDDKRTATLRYHKDHRRFHLQTSPLNSEYKYNGDTSFIQEINMSGIEEKKFINNYYRPNTLLYKYSTDNYYRRKGLVTEVIPVDDANSIYIYCNIVRYNPDSANGTNSWFPNKIYIAKYDIGTPFYDYCEWEHELTCDSNFGEMLNMEVRGDNIYAIITNTLGCGAMCNFKMDNTGIIESTELANIKVSPNPTDNYLDIKLENICQKVTAKVLDLTGKELFEMKFENTQEFKMNFPFILPDGTYSLLLDTDGKQNVTNFIISKK